MATKRMDIPDEVHTQIGEYAADYGCRSMAEALGEMVAIAMLASTDERLELRARKLDRQARLAGAAAAPKPARTRSTRSRAQKPADGPQDAPDAPAQPDTAQEAADGPVAAENGQYAHAGQ